MPASLWPSVPKLVDSKIIGSAYALIFWIQNIGLWLFPLLIGKILKASNPDIVQSLEAGTMSPAEAATSYKLHQSFIDACYAWLGSFTTWIVLACCRPQERLWSGRA